MKRVISLLMAMLMIFSVFAAIDMTAFAAFKAPEGRFTVSEKDYELAPGIVEKRIVTNSIAMDHQTKAYVAIADFNNPNVGFLAGYKDYDSTGTWGMQTVRDQARAASEAKGVKVVAAINADYYCMQDGNPVGMTQGQPYGALIMDGKVVNSPVGQSHYFAVLKDGTPVIRDRSEPWDDVQYAIGAPLRIVRGGEVTPNEDTSILPRCAIGITADNKVIIYTADGRQAPTSVGETVYETGRMMKALGCVEAAYLDGGGSSTYASQTVDETSMTVKSKPSDGTERKVSTTALLYYSETPVEVPTEKPDTTPVVPDNSCDHSWTPATCIAAKKCSKCGGTEGVALGHTVETVEGVPATCDKAGLTEGKECKVCGVPTEVQTEIPATGHTEEVVPAVAGTCLDKGLTEGKKCSTCGKVIVAQTETTLGEHVVSGNTCTVCGKTVTTTPEVTLAKVTGLKVKKTTSNSATLSWKQVANAESYKVSYSTNGKSWKSKTSKKTTLTIKGLSAAKNYQFKVSAVAGDAEGESSATVKGTTKYSTATLSSVKSSKKAQATVTWKKLSSASGYVVEYSTSKKFTSKTTKKVTIKKAKTTKTTLKKLKSGKKYYVRVKAYKTVSKKAVYGAYSSVKNVKVK